MNNIIQMLKTIGFNRMESQIYLALLQESKATGYRLAKLIGEPVSNTYKTILSLQRKGAVIVDESKKPKECIPVPIKDYYNLLEENFKKNRNSIEEELKQYSLKSPREGIFQIEKIDQVFEKGKQLILGAQKIIMADLYSYPLEIFKEILKLKAAEGVKTLVKTYEPIELKGCHVVIPSSKYRPVNWSFDWCNIIIDDKEFLIAFLEKDGSGVLQAIWSKSTYINLVLFSGFAHEFILTLISNSIYSGKPSNKILSELKQYYQDYMYKIPLITNFDNSLKDTIKKK